MSSEGWSIYNLIIHSLPLLRGNILLIIYVEAIIIIGDEGIEEFLQSSFQTKDLGKLHYFLGIEVAWSKEGFSLSQRKDIWIFWEKLDY